MLASSFGETRMTSHIGTIRSGILLLGLLLAMPVVVLADAVDRLTPADRAAIHDVIAGQIAAFRADDAATAFSYATAKIQARFGDPSRFIAMVKRGYLPVYRPRHVEFSELLDLHGDPAQRVVVIGPENDVFSAYYLMKKQRDGSWRIDGCLLRPISDRAI